MIHRYVFPLVLLIGLPSAAFLLGSYAGGLLTQFVALGLATAALAMCWGFAGILTLGHAVSFGIGAYAYAWCSTELGSGAQWLGMLLGVVLATAFSALVGFIGLRGQVDGVAFGLFTLVILFAAGQIAVALPEITGGFNGISGIRRLEVAGVELSPDVARLLLVVISVAIVLVIRIVMRGPLGGVLALLRDSPIRAASLGYRVPTIRIYVFAAAGGLAALAGSIYVAQVRFVSPSVVAISMAVGFVIWALIGSRASVLGAFSAAVVMGFITNELSDKLLNVWMLITGLLFIGFVVFAPQGIVEVVRQRLPRRMRGASKVELTPGESTDSSDANGREELYAEGINVNFGGFVAVRDAGLTSSPGVIHVLIGPNGAGKSTLLNALSGIIPGSRGIVRLGDADLSGRTPWYIARAGVGRKYQKPSLSLDLTVAQHLALGKWGSSASEWSLLFAPWRAEIAPSALTLMSRTGLDELLDRPAGELSHGQRQILELSMVLAASPKALLLDEPAAGMTRAESADLGELLAEVARETEIPILMVEHDMDLVRRIAGEVTVLASGEVIAGGPVGVIESDPRVRALYLGDQAVPAQQDVPDEGAHA